MQSIDRNAIPVDVSAAADRYGFDLEDPTIYIPSSFNYLTLKFHAFSDRNGDVDDNHVGVGVRIFRPPFGLLKKDDMVGDCGFASGSVPGMSK